MERSLLWGAFAIGIVGWLCAVLLARPRAESAKTDGLPRAHLIAAAALILLVHLATMPSSPPFARGHGFGLGFLLGGAAALIAAWTLYRQTARNPIANAAANSAPFFLAIPAAVIPLLFTRSNIIDVLLGAAIGHLAITTLLTILPNTQHQTPNTLLPGAAFTATLCATAALGIYRGATVYSEWKWGAVAALLAAAIPFLMLLSALPNAAFAAFAMRLPLSGLLARTTGAAVTSEETREAGARALRVILSALLLLGLAYLVSRKLVMQPAVLNVVLIGIIAALAAAWLLRDTDRPEGLNARTPEGPSNTEHQTPNTVLAVLVILAGIMVSYQMLAGFGVGLAILAGWLVGGIALSPGEGAESESRAGPTLLISALCFGTVFVIYRLATERFRDDLRGIPLTDHYALFGFVFGMLVPSLLSRHFILDRGLGASILKAGLLGTLALAAPAAIVLVWGQKTLLTFLFGLALAASPAFRHSGVQAFRNQALTALLAIGISLAVAQWTHLALPLAALPRADKLQILAWSIGIIAGLLIGSDLFARFKSRRQPATESA